MRGRTDRQEPMFLMINVEGELPESRPLRAIKRRADRILSAMSRDFNAAYSRTGRPSVPPEQLLKALLLDDRLRSAKDCNGATIEITNPDLDPRQFLPQTPFLSGLLISRN